MDKRGTEARLRPELFLGDRPRLEIPLAPGTAGSFPTRLVVSLPGPLSEDCPQGRFRADPRIPESEFLLAWGEVLGVPTALRVLTISVGDQSWTLEQDIHHPQRWRKQADPDARRHWS